MSQLFNSKTSVLWFMKTLIMMLALMVFVNCVEYLVGECIECTISCSTGTMCYKLTGDGFEEEICAHNDQCQFGGRLYAVEPCKIDVFGQKCPNLVCFTGTSLYKCYNDYLSGGVCPSDTFTYKCGECTSLNGCSYCHTRTASDGSQVQSCVDQHLSYCDWSAELDLNWCKNGMDSSESICPCCARGTYTGTGLCSTTDKYFYSLAAKIGIWAYS